MEKNYTKGMPDWLMIAIAINIPSAQAFIEGCRERGLKDDWSEEDLAKAWEECVALMKHRELN